MASLANDPGGFRRIIFFDAQHERKVIRLGHVDKRWAETALAHVEKLAEAALLKSAVPDETARWVADLPDVLRARFEAKGLVRPQVKEAALALKAFLDSYVEGRADLKPLTRASMAQAARCLVEHFGADRPLQGITSGDADEFRLHLLKKGMATTTTSRRVATCKQFFRAALRKRLIAENPFGDIRTGSMTNSARQHYIDRATAKKVIDACPPDSDLRVVFALARYGGLRCPSEIMGLTLADIHWDANRMTVHSPKTAHHAGHESRIVPLFNELRPFLQAAFDAAPDGTLHVIRNRRLSNAYLTKMLRQVLARAGVTRWPRLWQNLRASCATDLASEFAPHVAAKWLGHSVTIATAHYWEVRDTDFERAAGGGEAAQKAAHSGAGQHSQALSGEKPDGGKVAADSAGQGATVPDSDVSASLALMP